MTVQSPQIASGPLADLGYTEEVSYGQVPSTPVLKTCRRRSTTLGLTKESYQSEEVRWDRMVSDSRHGIRRAGGQIVTEISPASHADFYQALLGGFWQRPANINVAVGGTPVTVTLTDADRREVELSGYNFATGAFLIGDTLTFAGTSTVLDGAIFTFVALDGNDARAISARSFDLGDLPITTATGTMNVKGGRCPMDNIYRSFTFERAYTDIGLFGVLTGMRMASAAIDLPPTGIATATFTASGKDAQPLNSASIDGVAEVVLDQDDLTSLTFDAAARTITAAAGDFSAAGITVGDKVIIEGDGITDLQNQNPRTVIGVTATVLTVAEAIQSSSGAYSGPFTVTRVGLPDYANAPDENVLVAVSGVLVKDGSPIGTVTAMSINIDNQMGGSNVVGENNVPITLFGNQCVVSGNLTVLFDRGGAGQAIYNAFDLETDVSLIMRLDTADGLDAITFALPRCKINSGDIGDAVAEGLPVSVEFSAVKPLAANPRQGTSQIRICDSTIASPATV